METLFVLGAIFSAVVVLIVAGFSLMVFVEAVSGEHLEYLGEDELDKR